MSTIQPIGKQAVGRAVAGRGERHRRRHAEDDDRDGERGGQADQRRDVRLHVQQGQRAEQHDDGHGGDERGQGERPERIVDLRPEHAGTIPQRRGNVRTLRRTDQPRVPPDPCRGLQSARAGPGSRAAVAAAHRPRHTVPVERRRRRAGPPGGGATGRRVRGHRRDDRPLARRQRLAGAAAAAPSRRRRPRAPGFLRPRAERVLALGRRPRTPAGAAASRHRACPRRRARLRAGDLPRSWTLARAGTGALEQLGRRPSGLDGHDGRLGPVPARSGDLHRPRLPDAAAAARRAGEAAALRAVGHRFARARDRAAGRVRGAADRRLRRPHRAAQEPGGRRRGLRPGAPDLARSRPRAGRPGRRPCLCRRRCGRRLPMPGSTTRSA